MICKASGQKRKQLQLTSVFSTPLNDTTVQRPESEMQSYLSSVVQESAGISCDQTEDYTLVFFELETTGLDVASCDIIQVCAISGEKTFNVYVCPRQQISEEASSVNGFTVINQTLFLDGVPMETKSHEEALTDFLAFLVTLHRPVLVGHNIKRFDRPILSRIMYEFCLLNEFQKVVSEDQDTFLIAKKYIPNTCVTNFKFENLVREILKKSYPDHDSMEKVKLCGFSTTL
ncbi:uncharacterized protein LOC121294428 [Polyodon spathula]|uniref:uncharacterized protein LOC121294428 n=1 Tax=Polyodon spathula TaxID=7913 RepID=UPI001B7DB3AD|nr:uncharacterized protein LOC121294428 [Polyodon spathula]